MQYYSLNRQAPPVDFRTAAIQGQAPDKGLYFPSFIPRFAEDIIDNVSGFSKEELGFRVMKPYVGDAMDDASLFSIISETIDFPFPLVQVSENIYSLELFHGPTLAFKDVGARFMSRCLGYFSKERNQKITVLVATSGDTGGAVANGFLGVEGVEVVILYPSGKVSEVQELQLTTCGQNITALEIDGSFDDCQAMVKDAFMDEALSKKLSLTSANSINVARWLPQQLYYLFAWQQWEHHGQPPVVAVPSGNFGNICAGLLAHVSGLPVKQFIAACNTNDSVISYLSTGLYQTKKSQPTISNAMDVGSPSNFTRILELFQNDFDAITARISGYAVTDDATRAAISEAYNSYGYTLDPHGAVAFHALDRYLEKYPQQKGIFLETAHPVKFPATVGSATGMPVELPRRVGELSSKQKNKIPMQASFPALREWLLSR